MADELQYYGNPDSDSGLTITAKVYDSAGAQVGSDASCSEVGTLAIYIGDMPTASAGVYTVRFFSDGTFVAHGVLEWDGANEITNAMIDTVADSIKAKTDTLVNTDLTGIALTTDVTALNNLSSADITAAVPTASSIYTEFTTGSNEDVFKADVSGLSTLTEAQVNAQVDTALTDYDAPTKAELDATEASIIAALSTDEMTEAELHAALDSYTNKADWKASYSLTAAAVRTELTTELARIDANTSSRSTFDPATDTVETVTTVTNMRGTDNANTVAPDNASIASILTDTNELQTNQNNWLTADISGIETKVQADSRQTALIAEHDATQSAIAGIASYDDTVLIGKVDAIKAKTDTLVNTDLTGIALTNDITTSQATIIAAMPTPIKMTEVELHAFLDSYANKSNWQSDVSSLATSTALSSVASDVKLAIALSV